MKAEHLQECQVETPLPIVDLAWVMASDLRGGMKFDSVVDLGAGDARFARPSDAYCKYTGIEIDKGRVSNESLPSNATVINTDAMKWKTKNFDLCIGNPPYIRHHRLDAKWRNEVLDIIHDATGVRLKKTANLFVLFLTQALIKTKVDGLVVQVIPFEWVTRPSATELRNFISYNRWSVDVYRFNEDIFPTVLTTASITIIDKSRKSDKWNFWEIGADGKTKSIKQPSGSTTRVLSYENRAEGAFALRGLSPGSQEIFALTEQMRLHYGLKKGRDVRPCVTSLRPLPPDVKTLDANNFKLYYVDAGQRCWLIRSDKKSISKELELYLESVGDAWKAFSTCTLRDVWHQYKAHPVPQILASSGFVGKGPKIAVNEVGAITLGGVYGIFCNDQAKVGTLAIELSKYDFAKRVVSHSNNLKKVEVRQFNSVLAQLDR